VKEGIAVNIRKSALGFVMFFSLMPLCIFGVVSIYEMNRKIDSMTECNLRAVSENQITNIQKFAANRNSEMEKVASYDLTKEAIKYSLGESDETVDERYLDNLLEEQKKYGTFVASISVLDKNFSVVGSSEKYTTSETSQLKNADTKFHAGTFIMGDVYERQTDDGLKRVVPAYIGVYEKSELIGYISEELDTTYFDELRLNMDSLSSGTFYLLDGNNSIITAGKTTQKNSLTEFVTKSADRSDFQKKWNAIDREANPRGEIYYKYNGEQYITYYSNVENSNWTVRVTENLTAQKQDMMSYKLLWVILFVFFAVGTVIVQILTTRKFLQPIESAMDVFAKIKETQDYSLRIPVKSKDEMGQLSQSINELLAYTEKEKMYEKMEQDKLKQQAESDPLTGVKNKKAIEQYVEETVAYSDENKTPVAIGFLDIDDFRNFNTNYGHQVGDDVICYVAKTLQENISGEVGRIGGDEFVFCYAGAIGDEKMKADAARILKLLQENYINPESKEQIPITGSLGIVMAKEGGMDYTDLVRIADKAMYEAKNAGKNSYVVKVV
jgi:diguanylate cyclase (GGDEF)-like protein